MPADEFTKGKRGVVSMMSYSEATVVERSPNWFPRKHLTDLRAHEQEYCTPTCCATPIAISDMLVEPGKKKRESVCEREGFGRKLF